MVQKTDEYGILPCREGTAATEGRVRGGQGGEGGVASDADGGPKPLAWDPREGGGRGGTNHGDGGTMEEVRAGEGGRWDGGRRGRHIIGTIVGEVGLWRGGVEDAGGTQTFRPRTHPRTHFQSRQAMYHHM